MSMSICRDFLRFAFSLVLTLALCGSGSAAAVVHNADSSSDAQTGAEVLYGFPLTLRLNIGVTATIDPTTGVFSTVFSGSVPLFANSTAVASNARFLYVSNSFINGLPNNGSQIIGYSINSDGTLTPLSEPSPQFPFPVSIQGLATTPDGHFLYGADNSGGIFAFRVDNETGVLALIPGSPFTSGTNPQLVVDPTGKFLYASDDDPPGGILAFTIGSTGALTPVPGSPFTIPTITIIPNSEPFGIVATGSFVYAALSTTNRIAAFSVNSRTGALTPIRGPFSTGVVPTVLAWAKNFLYVVNAFDGSISGYRIHPSTGVLTPIPGSPFGSDSGALAIDPSGKYLYSGRGNGIQGYNIDPHNGALTLGSERFGENGVLGLTIVQLPQ